MSSSSNEAVMPSPKETLYRQWASNPVLLALTKLYYNLPRVSAIGRRGRKKAMATLSSNEGSGVF
jgi:hypothetical protein